MISSAYDSRLLLPPEEGRGHSHYFINCFWDFVMESFGEFRIYDSMHESEDPHAFCHNRHSYSKYTEALSKSEDNGGGHRKSRSKKRKSSREEDDLSQSWVCEEIDPFTPRIRYFDLLKTRMPSHIKMYDGSEDPEDHIKII
nr:reverse transcriptase domain-containing protein [Tanacetum cinerariifolium]